MTQPLENKIALVTGSSKGIGAAIAKRLAKDGAHVVVHFNTNRQLALDVVDEIRRDGLEAECFGADLGQSDGAYALLAQMKSAFGGRFNERLDVLVNNAGTFEYAGLTDATDDAFDRVFHLNVRSVFQLSREAARQMAPQGWGRIIHIGSVFGEAAPLPGMGMYCGTKFAVQGFTRAWSRDLGPLGITVNNIQPAVIQGEPVPTSGPTFDAMKRFTSVGRFGAVQDVAEMASFLANPNAGFINGESFSVDGGWRA